MNKTEIILELNRLKDEAIANIKENRLLHRKILWM